MLAYVIEYSQNIHCTNNYATACKVREDFPCAAVTKVLKESGEWPLSFALICECAGEWGLSYEEEGRKIGAFDEKYLQKHTKTVRSMGLYPLKKRVFAPQIVKNAQKYLRVTAYLINNATYIILKTVDK